MTTAFERRSPVTFQARPLKTEIRDNWPVVLEYEDTGAGPRLIDLSHRPKYDIQDGNLGDNKPWGITIPSIPGQSVFEQGMLLNRMNRTQISAWHLGKHPCEMPDLPGCTDVTESTLLLALMGEETFSIVEKLTAMDLMDPDKSPPFLGQGPLSHVPCQVVVFHRARGRSAVLWTCARGYGRDMVHAVLQAGEEYGLRPGGENLFTALIADT